MGIRRESDEMKYSVGLGIMFVALLALAAVLAWRGPTVIATLESQASLQDRALRNGLTLLARQGDSALLQRYLDGLDQRLLEGIAIANRDGVIVAASERDWIGGFLPSPCVLPDARYRGHALEEWPLLSESQSLIGRACWRYGLSYGQPSLFGLDWLARSPAVREGLTLVALLASVLLGMMAWSAWLARQHILDRLDSFKNVFERIAGGDFNVRMHAGSHRALASFGRALDRMLKEVGRSTEAVRRSEERFNLAVQGSNDAIWDWNVENDRLYLSPRLQEMLGFDERELPYLFTGWLRLIHGADRDRFSAALQAHIEQRRPFRAEFRVRARDGQWRWLLARGEAVRNRRGQALRVVGSYSDITESKLAEEALFAEKERAEVTLQSIADAVLTTDVHGRITSMNASAEALTGWDRSRAFQEPIWEVFRLVHAETGERLDVANQVVVNGRSLGPDEAAVLINAQGQNFFVDHSAAPIRDRGGQVIGMVVIGHDVTERHRLTQILNEEKERAEVTLQSIADGVITTDARGCIATINARAARLTGWDEPTARGRALAAVFNIVDERSRRPIPPPIEGVLQDGRTLELTENALLISRDRKEYLIDQSYAPIRDRHGEITGIVLVFHDTTERHKLIRKLSHQATHDALTQLINRYEFERRLKQALQETSRKGRRHSVCYLDLDQFKLVNDTCGHEAGDELLRQLAALLLTEVRDWDTLARLGGDEFGLLLQDCGIEDAVAIAKDIRQAIGEFRFIWRRSTFSIGVSIGVVEINANSGAPLEVMRAADQACYMAKHKGRNHIQVYQENDEESSQWLGQMHWVHHLTRALDENSLLLYAQPIMPLKPEWRKHRHHEILVRMRDDRGQIVSPGAFLPAAERYGLIVNVDRWVLSNAIATLAEAVREARRRGEMTFDTFSINLSGATLTDEDFLEFVKETLDEHRLPPDMLCFEITETTAVANFSQARAFVTELKKLGCRFALDDFGSGFASFGYLKSLPVDYLKIDGSFVRNIAHNQLDRAMVSSINHLGHVIGLKTIAEFVESDEIVQTLHALGVDFAQGFHFGRPQPLEQTLLRRERAAAQP